MVVTHGWLNCQSLLLGHFADERSGLQPKILGGNMGKEGIFHPFVRIC
uniref:Uncharacterized protein n=1 Tax=Rhizophora mucronata TaxID=61149 RepID=A0A2P2ISE4_RHIMU